MTQWGLQKHSEIQVRGYNGRRSKRPTYLVDILISERSFTAVKPNFSFLTGFMQALNFMTKNEIIVNYITPARSHNDYRINL